MTTNCSPPTASGHPLWLTAFAVLLITMAGGCVSATTTQGGNPATQPLVQELPPGIPNRPELVTVIPFYEKPNESDREKTKVVIPAEVNGRRGIFILDLGCVPTILNRTFLQPDRAGGVDSITDANRLPDNIPIKDYLTGTNPKDWEKVHIAMRIGTLLAKFDDPDLTQGAEEKDPHRYNAILAHVFGNFTWVFSPRLGNMGPAVLQQFETIIDYTHRRVVLIQLDRAGHRMVDVPAYTPRWTTPLVPVPLPVKPFKGLGIAVGPNNTLDTLSQTVDTANTAVRMIDTGAPFTLFTLGYDFLSKFGVFGINQRTHQFILYHK